ncbi:MAG TPA: GSCFA domain-containing protein [Cyclobacteriaceae bacterium]|nr:GSCFA domain-containing protein [Cyclobacteriaceae bacterium]
MHGKVSHGNHGKHGKISYGPNRNIMQHFRTEVTVTPTPIVDHITKIVTAGSCFADNIGQMLSENKFITSVNPLGVCYNPISIHEGFLIKEADDTLYVESQGTWRHFNFHSKFSDPEKSKLSGNLSTQLNAVRSFNADVIILTYGTAWVYRYQNKIVANCHKRPSSEFEKVLLTPEEIVQSFEVFRKTFKKKIILTLSPVRHIKDTLELNQVSKSVVRLAIHEILKKFPEVEYFPAYEIMMDDLRDYRFYETDMIHPSVVAVDYIWNKFGERYFTTPAIELMNRWQKLRTSLNHRAFHPELKQHTGFLQQLLSDLKELNTRLDVSKEITEIERRLND